MAKEFVEISGTKKNVKQLRGKNNHYLTYHMEVNGQSGEDLTYARIKGLNYKTHWQER